MGISNRQWLGLAALIVLCLTVGGVGGFATAQSVGDWYLTLNRPAWNPPSWLFAPVWTVLYIMMAVAAWRVWLKTDEYDGVHVALGLFFVQLFLNFLWSFIFFAARAIGWALVDISLMWIAIALTTAAFFRISRLAGALMLPYLAWVSFAAFLNFTIWRMN